MLVLMIVMVIFVLRSGYYYADCIDFRDSIHCGALCPLELSF